MAGPPGSFWGLGVQCGLFGRSSACSAGGRGGVVVGEVGWDGVGLGGLEQRKIENFSFFFISGPSGLISSTEYILSFPAALQPGCRPASCPNTSTTS